MWGHLVRRIWNGVLVLFGVVTVVFLIFGLKPGDPARMLADQRADPEALAAIRKDLGLDQGPLRRYLLYLNDVSPIAFMQRGASDRPAYLDPARYQVAAAIPLGGDRLLVLKAPYLRYSYQSRRPVTALLADAFPSTALLATVAMLIAVVLGIAMGTWAAVRQGTFTDGALLFLSALGMAGPSFFVAVLIAWLGGYVWYEHIPLPILPVMALGLFLLTHFLPSTRPSRPLSVALRSLALFGVALWVLGVIFHWPWATVSLSLPGTGLPMTGGAVDLDPFEGPVVRWRNLILPAITLGIRPLAVIVQLTRGSLLEELGQDHIRTARAKGLSEWQVVVRHGLRNALMPVLTAVSGWFASLLAGAVFIEYVFGWRGMGLEVFQALEREDLPVVMGAVLVFAMLFVVMNVVVDLLYAVLDPRVRTA